jgi:hypothetical protein
MSQLVLVDFRNRQQRVLDALPSGMGRWWYFLKNDRIAVYGYQGALLYDLKKSRYYALAPVAGDVNYLSVSDDGRTYHFRRDVGSSGKLYYSGTIPQ